MWFRDGRNEGKEQGLTKTGGKSGRMFVASELGTMVIENVRGKVNELSWSNLGQQEKGYKTWLMTERERYREQV